MPILREAHLLKIKKNLRIFLLKKRRAGRIIDLEKRNIIKGVKQMKRLCAIILCLALVGCAQRSPGGVEETVDMAEDIRSAVEVRSVSPESAEEFLSSHELRLPEGITPVTAAKGVLCGIDGDGELCWFGEFLQKIALPEELDGLEQRCALGFGEAVYAVYSGEEKAFLVEVKPSGARVVGELSGGDGGFTLSDGERLCVLKRFTSGGSPQKSEVTGWALTDSGLIRVLCESSEYDGGESSVGADIVGLWAEDGGCYAVARGVRYGEDEYHLYKYTFLGTLTDVETIAVDPGIWGNSALPPCTAYRAGERTVLDFGEHFCCYDGDGSGATQYDYGAMVCGEGLMIYTDEANNLYIYSSKRDETACLGTAENGLIPESAAATANGFIAKIGERYVWVSFEEVEGVFDYLPENVVN